MTRLIVVDNCTQCPYHFRFQNPKLGRICFKVTEKDKETKKEVYKLIESTPKDEIPGWCPLPEKINRPVLKGGESGWKLDPYTIKFTHGLGHVGTSIPYTDGVFEIPLKDWDTTLKEVGLVRTVSGVQKIERKVPNEKKTGST